MLPGALGHLQQGLAAAADPSPFETALAAQLHSLDRLLNAEVGTILRGALAEPVGLALSVDLDAAPAGDDITRLSCSSPTCPNKQR